MIALLGAFVKHFFEYFYIIFQIIVKEQKRPDRSLVFCSKRPSKVEL